MKRVTGVGGIFFKSQDPDRLREWYRKHLGIESESYGGFAFQWEDDPRADGGATLWTVFPDTTKYFGPSDKPFMINLRVQDLAWLMEQLRAEGVEVEGNAEESEYGKFGWVVDPDGNKVELWEPPPAAK